MFEAFTIWREILHVSEWTGLSVGTLAGLALLAWYVPGARTLAACAAVAIVCIYGGELHGNAVGRAEVKAEWDAAEAKAEAERKARDAQIAADLEAKYAPQIAAGKADDAQALSGLIAAIGSGPACPLGPEPLKLRQRSK